MRKLFTSNLKLTLCVLILALCCCAAPVASMASSSADKASQTTAEQDENIIEDEAVQALYTMSAYLRTLKVFEMTSSFYRDEVLTTGQKVLINGESTTLIRLPDKYFASVKVDEKNKDFQVYFDGQDFTLYGKDHQFYVTTPAPGTVADLVFKTFAEKGIELPLQDIFLWGTGESDREALTSAFSVGTTVMDGKACTHYAYRQEAWTGRCGYRTANSPCPCRLLSLPPVIPPSPSIRPVSVGT